MSRLPLPERNPKQQHPLRKMVPLPAVTAVHAKIPTDRPVFTVECPCPPTTTWADLTSWNGPVLPYDTGSAFKIVCPCPTPDGPQIPLPTVTSDNVDEGFSITCPCPQDVALPMPDTTTATNEASAFTLTCPCPVDPLAPASSGVSP